MSSILSTFYDIEMLYKQQEKGMNMNAIHINSLLDKKAVGAPVTTSNSSHSFSPGFFRRNSMSNMDLMNNGNKFPVSAYNSLKENMAGGNNCATALMNKENKFRDRAFSEESVDRSLERSQQLHNLQQQKTGSQINSTRYKTELCRPFEENGACKYGEKCQFAHGYHELRSLSRHPKYKTEPCRTFHTIGFCPYGPRCHFIHNADERRPAPANANVQGEPNNKSARELCGYGQRDTMPHQSSYNQRDRPKLHHSLSFSGFSSHHGLDSQMLDGPMSRTPPPPSSTSSCSPSFYEDVLSPNSMSCVNSAFNFQGQDLKALLAPLTVHNPNAFANHSNGAFYGNLQSNMCPPSPTFNMSHLQSMRRLNESPVFEPPSSPPDSLSDRESYASGSLSSSGSLSGSESPSLDAGRRLPIFSRLSISDD